MLSVTPTFGEFTVPVDAELVDAYGLELEWVVGAAVLGQQLLELADDLGQLIARHHRAGPAVADARGALQRHVGVAADIERHRLGRRRAHLQLVEVVELAVELDHAAGKHELDHLDHLVDALAPLRVWDAAPFEFLRRPADPDAEPEPVLGQVRHRPHLACQQQRVAGTELHHVRVEPQFRRHRAHRACDDQRIGPRGVLVPHPRTVGGVRDNPPTASPCRRSNPAARSSRTRLPLRSWRVPMSWSTGLIATLTVYCMRVTACPPACRTDHPHRVVL